MPITDAIPRAVYTASAGQTLFPYTWPLAEASELHVYANDLRLTLDADYTVTGIGSAGGNVVLVVGAAAGTSLVLLRHIPLSQDVDYTEHTPFPAEAQEAALDKLTRITQQLQEGITRAVQQKPSTMRAPVQLPDPSTLPTLHGGKKALVYNDGGTDLQLVELTTETGLVGDSIPAIAFAELPPPETAGRQRHVVSGAPAGLYHDTGIAWVGPTVYDPANKAGVDVSAKIAAVLADMTAAGGTIDARSFRGAQAWGTPVTLTRNTHLWLGEAMYTVSAPTALTVTGTANLTLAGAGIWSSIFVPSTAALQVLDFASDGRLHVSRLCAGANGIPQTAGFLIRLSPPTGASHHVIASCAADQLFESLVIGKANGVYIHDCGFSNAVSTEIRGSYWGPAAFDAGNTLIHTCIFSSHAVASNYGIQWIDSSGLYVSNCTILGYYIGVAAYATQPHFFNEICLYDNRINIQGRMGLIVQRSSGTGGFAGIHVSNNLFTSPHATYVNAIQLGAPGGADDILYASILNNRFSAQTADPHTLIRVNHANEAYIAGNAFSTANAADTAIGFPPGLTDLRIGRNRFQGFNPHAAIVPPPPVAGLVVEPETRTGVVNINPVSIPAQTQLSVDVSIPGLRPSHGDRISFERNGAVVFGLIYVGATIAANDTARLYLYNATGAAIDDSSNPWLYTWVDMVP